MRRFRPYRTSHLYYYLIPLSSSTPPLSNPIQHHYEYNPTTFTSTSSLVVVVIKRREATFFLLGVVVVVAVGHILHNLTMIAYDSSPRSSTTAILTTQQAQQQHGASCAGRSVPRKASMETCVTEDSFEDSISDIGHLHHHLNGSSSNSSSLSASINSMMMDRKQQVKKQQHRRPHLPQGQLQQQQQQRQGIKEEEEEEEPLSPNKRRLFLRKATSLFNLKGTPPTTTKEGEYTQGDVMVKDQQVVILQHQSANKAAASETCTSRTAGTRQDQWLNMVRREVISKTRTKTSNKRSVFYRQSSLPNNLNSASNKQQPSLQEQRNSSRRGVAPRESSWRSSNSSDSKMHPRESSSRSLTQQQRELSRRSLMSRESSRSGGSTGMLRELSKRSLATHQQRESSRRSLVSRDSSRESMLPNECPKRSLMSKDSSKQRESSKRSLLSRATSSRGFGDMHRQSSRQSLRHYCHDSTEHNDHHSNVEDLLHKDVIIIMPTNMREPRGNQQQHQRQQEEEEQKQSQRSTRTVFNGLTSDEMRLSFHDNDDTIADQLPDLLSDMHESALFDDPQQIVFPVRDIVAVQQSWQDVIQVENYRETIGEAWIIQMLMLDPGARAAMDLRSLRSVRFDQVTNSLVEIMDSLLCILTPDVELSDLQIQAQQLQKLGISRRLWLGSLMVGLEAVLPDISMEQKACWKRVMTPILEAM